MKVWKAIKGYEGIYEISNTGKVKSLSREKRCGHVGSKPQLTKERLLATSIDNLGYVRVKLSKNGRSKLLYVHRLLATAFVSNPKSYKEVNHIDGNKENNSIDNLEWCTRSHNMKHAFSLGLKHAKKGEENNKAKLTKVEVIEIRSLYRNKKNSQSELARKFGVSPQSIHFIVKNKTWVGVE